MKIIKYKIESQVRNMRLKEKMGTTSFQNNNISIKAEFIYTINSLSYSIQEIYKDFTNNIEKENSLINILEKNLVKSNKSIIETINYLKIYLDLDKNSLDDFFQEAKKIFKKLKIIFYSFKNLLNNNSQFNHNYNNILFQPSTKKSIKHNNNFILKNLNEIKNYNNKRNNINNNINIEQKAQTPINSAKRKKSDFILKSENKIKKLLIPENNKDSLINNLKKKLKILEQTNKQLYQKYNLISKQKSEVDENYKELSKKYSALENKYLKLEKNCYDCKSEDKKDSNDEVEFSLKMMVKGIKEKNFSEDMNIDNPLLAPLKEKLKNTINKYNSLAELVQNLILIVEKNNRNKNIIDAIVRILFGISFNS